jgi:hypothetical protein
VWDELKLDKHTHRQPWATHFKTSQAPHPHVKEFLCTGSHSGAMPNPAIVHANRAQTAKFPVTILSQRERNPALFSLTEQYTM